MYASAYTYFANYARQEGFSSHGDSGALIVAGLGILLLLLVQLLIVQWLWNNVLTRVVPGVKPLPSLIYTLGLLVLVDLLLSGSA